MSSTCTRAHFDQHNIHYNRHSHKCDSKHHQAWLPAPAARRTHFFSICTRPDDAITLLSCNNTRFQPRHPIRVIISWAFFKSLLRVRQTLELFMGFDYCTVSTISSTLCSSCYIQIRALISCMVDVFYIIIKIRCKIL